MPFRQATPIPDPRIFIYYRTEVLWIIQRKTPLEKDGRYKSRSLYVSF